MISLQLVKLEAYGFKSFADKLEIEFGKGVTAIVGPNGSGKSNITDAIKWVLGEQNIRNLRGAKAEDIIFAGGTGRKALGVAEVSLLFDNANRKLPIDFNEVKITRRLFRSGDSEYYINKAACRLKDIHDLFADSGLGRDSMSVISQNKVDQILNSKPEERRLIFEEVAGITKFRNRKKESLKKLDETQQNLTRVYDIIAEIESQLELLEVNAQKTEKYNELHIEFKKGQVALLADSFKKYQKILEEANQKIIERQNIALDIDTKINLNEVEQEKFTNEIASIDEANHSLAQNIQEHNSKIDRANSEKLLLEERINQNNNNIERLNIDNKEINKKEISLQNKITEIQNSFDNDLRESKTVNALLKSQEEEISKLKDEIIKTETEVLKINDTLKEQSFKVLNSQNKLNLYDADLKNKTTDMTKIQINLQDILKRKECIDKEIDQQNNSYQVYNQEIVALKQKISKLQENKKNIEADYNELKNSINNNNSKFSSLQAKRNILSNMQDSYEGFGKGVKEVLKSKQTWAEGICGVVAEVINVKKEFVTAIETALGGSLQNVITVDEATAKNAIEYLRKEKLGRVTFLPLPNIKPASSQDYKFLNEDGIINFADKVVDCDEKYRKVIQFLLGRTIIAENIDSALNLARKTNFTTRIVTLTGEILTPGGALTGGGKYNQENSFLNRDAEINKLNIDIDNLQKVIVGQIEYDKQYQNDLAVINNDIDAGQENIKALEVKSAEIKIHIDRNNQLLSSMLNESDTCNNQLRINNKEILQLQDQIMELKEEITVLEKNDQVSGEKEKEINENLTELKETYSEINNVFTNNKILYQAIEAKINRHNELIEIYQNEILELIDKIDENDNNIANLQISNAQLQENIAKNMDKAKELLSAKGYLEKKYQEKQALKLESLSKQQECEKTIKVLRKQQQDCQNKLHELALMKNKYEYELERCSEELTQNHNINIAELNDELLPTSINELKNKLKTIEIAIEDLGLINHNAIEEFKAAQERYAFLQEQSNDLSEAKDYLTGVIAEIDANMSKQFSEAIDKVNCYFGETFKSLFGGGEAKLKLSDKDNLLETGIEIIVQPPDKKMQNLVLLSGGERALTVIALLFAFLKFKPAPFSVVDEIDAPLDEANLGRFSTFLQEYAQKTQFIVVTHRKGTMQAADVMHGVTVEDSGVSKVISVKIDDF